MWPNNYAIIQPIASPYRWPPTTFPDPWNHGERYKLPSYHAVKMGDFSLTSPLVLAAIGGLAWMFLRKKK